MRQIVLAISGLLMLTVAHAASFDCAKAATKVEKMICSDAELSKLDEELNAAYKAALQDKMQAASIKQTQRQWLKERNGCTGSECLKHAYLARLQALSPANDDSTDEPDCHICGIELGIQEREKEIEAALSREDAGLFDAVEKGEKAAVEKWLAAGANVNARHGIVSRLVSANPDDTYTPLHVAAGGKNIEIVELLLAKGAQVDEEGEAGQTPLMAAACGGTKEIVALLLEKGADINARGRNFQTNENSETLLHIAARCGKTEIADLLIARGMDVNARNDEGKTPLHEAARNGFAALAGLLLSKGAQVDAKDQRGMTPLLDAAMTGTLKKELAELLAAKGANINARTADGGETPLHAVRDSAMAEFLLAKGADIRAQDKLGETPLHWAARMPKEKAELLLSKGADVNARNSQGKTPLGVAIGYHNNEVAAILRAHGGRE